MVESIYGFLAKVGFTHPLHPMLTHVPMGMIIGMVIFAFLGLIWKNSQFNQTAFYCSVLAFLGVFPVIGAGLLDWLQFMEGEWNTFIIIKMILGTTLIILLGTSIIFKRKGRDPKTIFLIYILCLACAGGLGYSGGELVYG